MTDRETVKPRGADRPLPPLPADVEVTPQDGADAARLWDRLMPERYRGLLAARTGPERR